MGIVVSGGGPAGMMTGLLLARGGFEVTVLEKHHDFRRDFRGDTVHASTVRLMDELGLGRKFAALPQSRLMDMRLRTPDGGRVQFTDFGKLPKPYNYIAMIPQWDLLDMLADEARREPSFTLRMDTEATGLIREGGKVVGVRTRTRDGRDDELRADLTIAADGRHSVLRDAAGLVPEEFPVPFDTWWFRLSRSAEEQAGPSRLLPWFGPGEFAVSFPRPDFFQVGYFTAKGSDSRLRAEGIERFRERIAKLMPQFADRVGELTSMDDVHVLDVRLNRLPRWYADGFLCIGDAAHAMSPAGGVGINLAIQDAVAAATLLAEPLRRGRVTTADLARLQQRRWRPTVIMQRLQRMVHDGLFAPVLNGGRFRPPTSVLLAARYLPWLRRIPSYLLAVGPRPEHAPGFARRAAGE